MVDDDRLEEDEELVEDEELDELDELAEEEDEGSSSGSLGLMYVLVVTVFAWLTFSACSSIGCEISLTSSSESWWVIEDGGEWNSGKFRCGYRDLGFSNSGMEGFAFLVDLRVDCCSHKISLS